MLTRVLKATLAMVMAIGMTMCHPVAAETKSQRIGQISMGMCKMADHYISVVYRMAKEGRDNYAIMAYLDEVTDSNDREYPAILMAKVNVSSIQLSVRRAYSEKAVVTRHNEICIEQIGNDINRY